MSVPFRKNYMHTYKEKMTKQSDKMLTIGKDNWELYLFLQLFCKSEVISK